MSRLVNRWTPSPPAGIDGPWPDARRFPVTRRLLALWRWEWERGEDSEAANNARASLQRRTEPLGVQL